MNGSQQNGSHTSTVHILARDGEDVLCVSVAGAAVGERPNWQWNREMFEDSYRSGVGCQTCAEILHS